MERNIYARKQKRHTQIIEIRTPTMAPTNIQMPEKKKRYVFLAVLKKIPWNKWISEEEKKYTPRERCAIVMLCHNHIDRQKNLII